MIRWFKVMINEVKDFLSKTYKTLKTDINPHIW